MKDSSKSMDLKERLGVLPTADAPKDLEQLKSMPEKEKQRMAENNGIGPESKVLTFGQKAVGLTFNPSGDPRVVKAKQLIADAIDLLEEVHQEKTDNGAASSTWYRNVFRTEAFNQLVNASSSLVKYLTWQD